jgi:hypothetical protein
MQNNKNRRSDELRRFLPIQGTIRRSLDCFRLGSLSFGGRVHQ